MTDALQSLRRIAPSELQMMLADTEGGAPLMLVDVREPREFAAGHLPGAINMPMSELDRRLAELPARSTVVFMCRSGGRSLRACGQALRGGTVTPLQLEGGLLAWAAEVDPALIVASAG